MIFRMTVFFNGYGFFCLVDLFLGVTASDYETKQMKDVYTLRIE